MKNRLIGHRKTHQSDNNLFQCYICQKLFSAQSGLVEHTSHHHEYHPYKCEQCSNTFDKKNDFSKHIEAHTERKYCHMFNNYQKCKYGKMCIFLHEKAKFCSFDGYCTRPSCQYRHKFGCLEKNRFSNNNFMKRKVWNENIFKVNEENKRGMNE